MRALNGEVLQGKGVTAERAAAGGSSAWLLEHLVEDFSPCWQQNLGTDSGGQRRYQILQLNATVFGSTM